MMNFEIIGTPLFQWEVGRQLKIVPLRNMRISAVHFSNYGASNALVVQPKEENGVIIADIPNILLQNGQNLVVYSVNVSDDCVETLLDHTFPVRSRAKPSDYVYTETEVLTWQALDERIKALEEGGGSLSEPGEDGGYYTPIISQVDENTVNVSFEASKEGMPEVPDLEVTLPSGKDGKDGTDGQPGAAGKPGADGVTPHIGTNGNWFVGDTDTGKPSCGEDAPKEAVLYTPQDLTPEQQAQALANLGLDELPTGGGSNYRLIYKIVIDETNQTKYIKITQDMDGKPLELTKVLIYADWLATTSRADCKLKLNNIDFQWFFNIEQTAYKNVLKAEMFDDLCYINYHSKIPGTSKAEGGGVYAVNIPELKINEIVWRTLGVNPPPGSTFAVYGY